MKGLIFTFAMTLGGSFAALWNPYIGFLVYVAFAILKPEYLWDYSVPLGGNYSRIVGVALLLGWGLQGCGSWQFGRARGIVTALLVYLLWSFPSSIAALDPGRAWLFVESMAKIVGPFLVGITLIHSMQQLKQLAWVILVSNGWVALELNRAYYDGFNYVQELGFGGMDNNCVAIEMVTCVGLGFFLGLHAERLWQKVLAFACAALTGHVIMLAFSRGGMLALCVTGCLSFFLIPKKPMYYLYFVLAVLLALRLAGQDVRDRFNSSFAEERDYNSQSRLELWAACGDVMLKKPLLGVGPDCFGIVAPEYGFNFGKKAHSLWMEVGAELGIPGLIALATFYGLCVIRLWPLTWESRPVPDPWVRHFARMVISSIIGFAVAAQFVTLEGLEAPYYIVLIGCGVLKLSTPAPNSAGSLAMEQDALRIHGLAAYSGPVHHPLAQGHGQSTPVA